MKEFYEILGLNESVTMEQVIEAYTRLAVKNNPSNGGSQYIFNMIHFAYNEIINNFNKKEQEKLFLDSYEIHPKSQDLIIDTEVEFETKYTPKPEEICKEVYLVFTYLNTNPFLKDDNYDFKSIIHRYNGLQLKKEDNKKLISLKENDLLIRKGLFTKEDIISKVGPAIDLSLYICSLYNYDVDNYEAKAMIKMMLIKEAAKDVIAKNGGMVLMDK